MYQGAPAMQHRPPDYATYNVSPHGQKPTVPVDVTLQRSIGNAPVARTRSGNNINGGMPDDRQISPVLELQYVVGSALR